MIAHAGRSKPVRWACPECGIEWIDDEPENEETPRCVSDEPEHSSGDDRMGVRMERVA